VEQVHKLVESDEVLLIFNPLGTASNTAIRKYLNAKSVPQLFVASGAAKWGDPKAFPWTMGWTPNFQLEGQVYARYIVANHPKATIGVLYQNDDLGKDYLKGLRDALGAGAGIMILKEVPFEVTDPTIDSQIVLLKSLNPDILLDFATPKFAAQAIKKLAELNWTPIHVMSNVSISVAAVMRTAGLENGKGTLSAAYLKDPTDPRWRDDSGMSEWRAFMSKYYPDGDKMDAANVYGYSAAQGLAQVLKQCGDDLTRENVMKQAANLDFEIDTFLPGMRVKTSPTDFYPLKQLQMMRFNGEGWDLFGPLISAEIGG
jgi:ABC-type branched-subunit amino acid transport system substrate-binding protein